MPRRLPAGIWAPDGKALFVRGGRLVFDMGWVGAVESRSRVADGNWHDVAMTWEHSSGGVRLFVDGKADGQGVLKPKSQAKGMAIRIGFASPDFPRGQSYFDGEIADVRFYSRRLESRRHPRGAITAQWTHGELEHRRCEGTDDCRFQRSQVRCFGHEFRFRGRAY